MRNNKRLGNGFETEFCNLLEHSGYFAYNLPNKVNGQPFDIIAIKRGIFLAFECKTCNKDRFMLSRLEDNQVQALEKLKIGGSESNYYLACKFSDGIRILNMVDVVDIYFKNDFKYIDKCNMVSIEKLLNGELVWK